MSRIAGLANGIARSGVRLGPLDAVFAGLDYADGKAAGEDNIRAAAGAAGSTLGGWGGAMAGATAGAAIGSVVPIVGTAIGGAIGAIAGGMGGANLGGWGADRVDEAVRGNQGASESERNNDRNAATTAGLGVAGIGGATAIAKNKNMKYLPTQQIVHVPTGHTWGRSNSQALDIPSASYSGAGNNARAVNNTAMNAGRGAANFVKNLPYRSMGVAGAVLAGGAIANNLIGNPVGGAIDKFTNGATNLRPDDPTDYGQRREAGRYNPSTPAYNPIEDANNSVKAYADREDYIFNRNLQTQREFAETAFQKRMEYERDADARTYEYDLGRNQQQIDAKRELEFAGLQAGQATAMLNSYQAAGANATNQLSAILGARYF